MCGVLEVQNIGLPFLIYDSLLYFLILKYQTSSLRQDLTCCPLGSLLTMDPIPTPLAPAARARGAVTSLSPEAHMTGMETAREIANAVADVQGFSEKLVK